MTDVLLPTSLVGSYAQPDWLIDRDKLAGLEKSAPRQPRTFSYEGVCCAAASQPA